MTLTSSFFATLYIVERSIRLRQVSAIRGGVSLTAEGKRKEKTEQVNVRISADLMEVLKALVFLEDHRGAAEALRPLVENYLLERQREKAIKDLLNTKTTHHPAAS